MDVFYAPDLKEGYYNLPEEESRHVIRVLRKRKGDSLFLTNGLGAMMEATVVDDSPKQCSVRIIKTLPEYKKRIFNLHIAIAPTKNIDRFEWFLEKSTEIGIDEITPMFCEHSERTRLNHDRLQKVLVAAMKQSQKAYLPKLNEHVEFGQLIQRQIDGEKYIAYCDQDNQVELQNIYCKGAKTLILIGPEGDFSIPEVESAKKEDYLPITLGKSRLRTETAGIVACHIVNLLNS